LQGVQTAAEANSRYIGPYTEQHESRTLSHPNSIRSIPTLSSYVRLDLPSGPFPSGFLTNIITNISDLCHSRVRLKIKWSLK